MTDDTPAGGAGQQRRPAGPGLSLAESRSRVKPLSDGLGLSLRPAARPPLPGGTTVRGSHGAASEARRGQAVAARTVTVMVRLPVGLSHWVIGCPPGPGDACPAAARRSGGQGTGQGQGPGPAAGPRIRPGQGLSRHGPPKSRVRAATPGPWFRLARSPRRGPGRPGRCHRDRNSFSESPPPVPRRRRGPGPGPSSADDLWLSHGRGLVTVTVRGTVGELTRIPTRAGSGPVSFTDAGSGRAAAACQPGRAAGSDRGDHLEDA